MALRRFGTIAWLALIVAALAFIVGCGASNAPARSDGTPKAGAGTTANGPRIAVSEESFDFGNIPLNKVVSHTFKIKNVGNDTLAFLGQPTVRAVQGC